MGLWNQDSSHPEFVLSHTQLHLQVHPGRETFFKGIRIIFQFLYYAVIYA